MLKQLAGTAAGLYSDALSCERDWLLREVRRDGLLKCMSTRLLLTAMLLLLALATPALAQADVVRLAEGVTVAERSSNPAQRYGYPGANLMLNAGAILGVRDIQGGWWDPARPSMLNLDIGAGNAQNPGILNLGADVTRMVRVQNGDHETVLATRSDGVDVLGRLRVCDGRCLDLGRELRRSQARVSRLEGRVARLARQVRRISRER